MPERVADPAAASATGGPALAGESTLPRPELCVGAVVVDDGRLLLVRRGRPPGAGRWSVPGGRVEHGETVCEAVVREVAEETGLRCECGPLLGWVERIGEGFHFVILDFRAGLAAGNGAATAGDDAAEVAWVPLADIATVDTVDGLVDFLAEHGVLDPVT
jgi:ADP-ribose pyrophosphatase YjhB (NUDIX family)